MAPSLSRGFGACTDPGAVHITEDGELLRELTLDPSRDYQPQT